MATKRDAIIRSALPGFLICMAYASALRGQSAPFPRAALTIDQTAPEGAKGYVIILPAPGATPIRVLKNRFSAISPVVSPDRTRFAFDDVALAADDTRPACRRIKCRKTKLVVADWSGHIVLATSKIMAPVWGPLCEAFDVVEWVDNDRIGIGCDGFTRYTYSVIAVPSGKIERSYVSWLRTPFVWSPDRHHVAYAANVPHWPPNAMRTDQAAIDDQLVPERDKQPDLAVHHVSGLVWSADSQRIAWIDSAEACPADTYRSEEAGDACELHDAGPYLAVAGLDAGYWTMALPGGCAGTDLVLIPRWTDATHIALPCAGKPPISTRDPRFAARAGAVSMSEPAHK